MRVIPVIDLMDGLVVRGVAGRRAEYRPIESRIAADARPATVAAAFSGKFEFDTAYVADLDAIMYGRPNVRAWEQIAAGSLKLWLDAGVGSLEVAKRVMDNVAQFAFDVRLVVGLESLESKEDLFLIHELCGRQPPLFSLDLKDGLPLVRNEAWRELSPLQLLSMATSAGIQDVIVLDLADVGTGGGTRTLELCREVRRSSHVRTLIAGGGVRGTSDLRLLARAGCDAALVASALHAGELTPEDVRQARGLPH
jgi:phosphoribosylformimino-5-aminoimidazole carboxamide ribotide isomerase